MDLAASAAASAGIYRSLFESSPQPIVIIQRETFQVLKGNEAAARQFGYSVAELSQLNLAAIWPQAAEVLEGSNADRMVHRHMRRDGARIDARVQVQPLPFPGQSALALYITDVTESELSTRLIAAHRSVLETLARRSPVAVVLDRLAQAMEELGDGFLACVLVRDAQDRVEAMAAPSLSSEYRRTLKELPVSSADISADPHWRGQRENALAQGLRACSSMLIRSSDAVVLGAISCFYRRTGEPSERDTKIVGSMSSLAALVIENVTADRALLASEGRLWTLLDHAFAIVWLKDVQGRYLLVNRRFEQVTGIRAPLAVGRTDHQLFPRRVAEGYSANDAKVLELRKAIEFEEQIEQRDGAHIYLSAKFPALHPGGDAYGLGAIMLDITERDHTLRDLKRLREELRALATRLEGVRDDERAAISREIHDEFGQMLTSLGLSLTVLARSIGAGVQDTAALASEIAAMQRTVEGLLASVRRLATNLRPIDVDGAGLADAIGSHIDELKKRTGIACKLRIDDGIDGLDRQRATALFRIYQEALTNVLRHAAASEIAVELRRDGAVVELSVIDNGRGVLASALSDAPQLGLIGMRERAASVGGSLVVARPATGGTQIAVRIPAE